MLSIDFELNKKLILNSNAPKYRLQHASIVKKLRNLAADEGVKYHRSKDLDVVLERLEVIRKQRDLNRRNHNKEFKDTLSAGEQKLFDGDNVPYLFNRFSLVATVYPPTRRRIDPPNLYPTLKPLVDGLTDASFWVDDNYKYLIETSFRYGGLSGIKDYFRINLTIDECESLENCLTVC